jgi:MFS family permease
MQCSRAAVLGAVLIGFMSLHLAATTLFRFQELHRVHPPADTYIVLALTSSQAALLAIWAALARRRILIGGAVIVCGSISLVLIVAIPDFRTWSWAWGERAVVKPALGLVVFLGLVTTLLSLVPLRRKMLQKDGVFPEKIANTETQFAMADLLILGAVVAVLLPLGRMTVSPPLADVKVYTKFLTGQILLPAMVGGWVAFWPNGTWTRVSGAVLFGLPVGAIGSWLSFGDLILPLRSTTVYYFLSIVATCVFIAGSLLVVQGCGYRLVHRGPADSGCPVAANMA